MSETVQDAAQPRSKRSLRIWLFIILSLVPGILAAGFREEWTALAPGVRWSTYVLSFIFIVAACVQILGSDSAEGPAPSADPATPGTVSER